MVAGWPHQREGGLALLDRVLNRLNSCPRSQPGDRFGICRGIRIRVEHDGAARGPLERVYVRRSVRQLEFLTRRRARTGSSAALLQLPRYQDVENLSSLGALGMAWRRDVILEPG